MAGFVNMLFSGRPIG